MENQNGAASAWDVRPPEKPIKAAAVEKFVPPEAIPSSETNEPTPTNSKKPKAPSEKHHSKLRLSLLIALPIIFVALVAWTLGNVYFAKYKLGDSTISAHLSDAALKQIILGKVQDYKLTLTYPNKTKKSFRLKDMGIAVDTPATIASFKSQQHQLKNRLTWWQPVSVKLKTKVDSKTLNTFVSKHATVIAQPAKDAQLTVVNGKVKVTDASAGKEYGLSNAPATILAEASHLQTKGLRLKTLALHPALTAVELANSKTKLEKTLNQHISFSINGQTITPSPNDIAAWLDITPDKKAKTADITVNSGKVASYIDSIAAGYIQPPRAQVNVKKGNKTVILVKGQNGTDVTNKSAISTKISKNLLNDQGIQLALTVSHAPYKTITAGNWTKWIEVDLTNMRLYAYEKSKLVNTFLVSAGRPDTPTVVGQYAIYRKFASQTMTGPNVDGSYYVQPNVPWVNYFYKDFAIHGNYWRPTSVFGHVATSHGCVGLLDNDAAWVYNWAPVGTPVITHY